MGRVLGMIIALLLCPFLSKFINSWGEELASQVFDFSDQIYLRELFLIEEHQHRWILGSLFLSYLILDRVLSIMTRVGYGRILLPHREILVAYFVVADRPPLLPIDLQMSRSPPIPIDPELLNPPRPNLSIDAAELSGEVDEAFNNISRASRDAVPETDPSIASSSSTPSPQSPTIDDAESSIASSLHGATPIPGKVPQDSAPQRMIRGRFSWDRFSPMKEPMEFIRGRRLWRRPNRTPSAATSPLGQEVPGPEAEFTDTELAVSPGFAGSNDNEDMETLALRARLAESALSHGMMA